MSALLEIVDLKVHFPVGGRTRAARSFVHAVDGVSFALEPEEIVAVVGESGCGKTTLARAILGLNAPTSGSILFRNKEIANSGNESRDAAVRREIQMIFQDPFDSLNPRKTILQTLSQPLRIHGTVPRSAIRDEVIRLLDIVGMSPGATYLHRYPHQFSGGQRQRICIARAIALRPSLVVADEAVSALDISIRAQILLLMQKLRRELGLGYLFITHDLGVVRSFCDRVIVMYLGHVVEEGPTEQLFKQPRHPYTVALLNACPIADPAVARARTPIVLEGDIPSPIDPPSGCRFHTRCPMVQDICRAVEPPRVAFENGQWSRCHFARDESMWASSKREQLEVLE